MSDTDNVLGLLDDLVRLATEHGVRIEVEADGFAAAVTPAPTARARGGQDAPGASGDGAPTAPKTQRVHAATVGIFTTEKPWKVGDAVKRGDVLGGVQSLGRIADVKSPADGTVHEVLVAPGAPVEYGQPLFVIALS